jgi:PAS domain S-box-containing protein
VKTTPALPEWCWKSYLGHGLLDADGAWICLNPALCYLFQRPAGEFLGRRLDENLGEPSREVFRKAWEDVVSGALPSRCMDLEFPAPDGGRLFTDAFLTKFEEVPGAMMLQILNITRHKETENELAAAKRRLHLTAAVAGMGFWEYDFQTTAQNWDDGVFRIYGIKREDFSGRWDTYVHPEDIERSHQTVLDTIEKSDSGEQDFRAVLPDGSIRHVHSIFTVDRDAEGKPLRLTGINFDITDSVEGREAEARNEASLRMILDNLPIPVTTSRTTGDGEITLINKEFTRLLGYTAEDAQTIKRLVELNFPDPEIQAQSMAWWRDLIAHSKENPTPAREVPFQVKSKAGEFRDLLANATVVDDTLILASHDITQRKAAETKLQEIRKTLERILEDMPVPVMVIDADPAFEDRRFLMANRKFTEILGYTLEDMPSAMAWAAKAYPEEEYRKMVVDWWRDALANAAHKNKPIENVEFFVMGKDGVTRDILFHTTLVGGLIVIAMQDVTEQKKAAAELEAAYRMESTLRSEAERIALARSRFLAGVSHEIRTPISALVNLSQSLLMESEKHALPEEFVEHLEKVRAGGQYLNLILTNLLDLSAAGSGHTPVRPQNFYLRDWVEDIGALIEAIARGRSTEIIWRLPEDENEKFSTDAVRLSQILLNLAQNAVKFSTKPNARIWISISKKGSSLELSIADEGPGIPPGKLDELFKEFGQSDTNTNLMDRGVGLGLAVVRQNVSLLGGGISARPVEPTGICFEITVPELHKQPTP